MENGTLIRYADLEAQIQALEEEKEKLRPTIVAEMEAENVKKFNIIQGTFSVQERTTWKYSPAVEKAEAKVKEMKKEEEADGVAEMKVAKSLRFQLAK